MYDNMAYQMPSVKPALKSTCFCRFCRRCSVFRGSCVEIKVCYGAFFLHRVQKLAASLISGSVLSSAISARLKGSLRRASVCSSGGIVWWFLVFWMVWKKLIRAEKLVEKFVKTEVGRDFSITNECKKLSYRLRIIR